MLISTTPARQCEEDLASFCLWLGVIGMVFLSFNTIGVACLVK
jgi:hypothetical protein